MAAPGASPGFFDLWSRFYDIPLVQRAAYRPVHDAVLAALPARPRPRILDLGCGTGQFATRMQREVRGARVVGCDFSPGMLAQAAARSRRVAWVRGDAQRLPFADATFDAVTSTEAFHWFPDQRRALAECLRVLAPGGTLLVAAVAPPLAVLSAAAAAGGRLVGQPFYWPTADEMRGLVEGAGFALRTQRRLFRLPGLLLLPVLTVATRPPLPPRRRPRRRSA